MRMLIEADLQEKFKNNLTSTVTSAGVNRGKYADLDFTVVIVFEGLFSKFEKAIE